MKGRIYVRKWLVYDEWRESIVRREALSFDEN
jgi:hypothetical protein